MKSFEFGNLTISVELKDETYILKGTVFDHLAMSGCIDEEKMMELIKDIEKQAKLKENPERIVSVFILATILYNKDSGWQKTSFRLLAGIGKGFNIEVNAV